MLEFIHRKFGVPYSMSVHYDHDSAEAEATVVLLHGIGNSGAAWQKVIPKLPRTMHIIALDLIGFGESPKPSWAKYDVAMQARSLRWTLEDMGVHEPIILVGHSLGSLVAIEYAKRHQDDVRSLVLCSPPFYEYTELDTPLLRRKRDDLYKRTYGIFTNMNKDRLSSFVKFAVRTHLMDEASVKNEEMLAAYVQTLESSIINQTSLADAILLKCPVHVITGLFDPLVISKNIRRLRAENARMTWSKVPAGHEVNGSYVNEVVERVESLVRNRHLAKEI